MLWLAFQPAMQEVLGSNSTAEIFEMFQRMISGGTSMTFLYLGKKIISIVVSTRNVYVGLFSISKILSSRHNHYYSVGGTALWYTPPLWLLQMMELDITMHSMH